MDKDKRQPVKINLRSTVGVRGPYYGPGEGIEVPYDVAESIALSQGKSVDDLVKEAESTKADADKETAPTESKTDSKGAKK